ncbi:MAG: hypothetical protein FVQ85_16440 [Planctomycetes bacterium]|nr:hypothetical protein [Planctomycetota bacterium]
MRSNFSGFFFAFAVDARKKGRGKKARPVCAEDIHKSLFDLEFELVDSIITQILALAAQAMKKVGVKGTVKNIGGTKRRSV